MKKNKEYIKDNLNELYEFYVLNCDNPNERFIGIVSSIIEVLTVTSAQISEHNDVLLDLLKNKNKLYYN